MNSDDKLISVGKLRDFWNAIKTKFATAAQGAKADTALQKTDIISGTLDGTISVDGTNVPVKGLGSAAYMIVGRNLGNVPMNGASLGTTANVPVVTNTRGQLAPHSSGALGTMAFKEASNYATKATTLSGYGITDAYTKTQSDTALTTHKTSGDHDGRYYTESEVDSKINALNSNIIKLGNPDVLFSGSFTATTMNQLTYKTISNLSAYHLIAIKIQVGDATHSLEFFITGLEWESIVSGFSRDNYYGRVLLRCEPDNNRIGLNVLSMVGWNMNNIQITAVYGFI